MSTITAYYCSFCEAVNNAFRKIISVCESIGRARAAHQLSLMGRHEEARELMTQSKESE